MTVAVSSFSCNLYNNDFIVITTTTTTKMMMIKGKGKAEHLYSILHCIQTTLKRSGMDHTVLPAINTIPAFTS